MVVLAKCVSNICTRTFHNFDPAVRSRRTVNSGLTTMGPSNLVLKTGAFHDCSVCSLKCTQISGSTETRLQSLTVFFCPKTERLESPQHGLSGNGILVAPNHRLQ